MWKALELKFYFFSLRWLRLSLYPGSWLHCVACQQSCYVALRGVLTQTNLFLEVTLNTFCFIFRQKMKQHTSKMEFLQNSLPNICWKVASMLLNACNFHLSICICICICRCPISEDKRWISEEEPFDNCDSHRWEACLCDNDKPLLCPDRSAFVKSSANKLSKSVVPIFSSFLIAHCYIISKLWLSNVLEMLCQMDPFHSMSFNSKEVKIY